MMDTINAYSNGGGVQSIAALVLAAEKKIAFNLFLFANVGEDSENPDTLKYMEQYAMPFAQQNGIEMIELRKIRKDGSRDTLYGRITNPKLNFIGIPVRMSTGFPASRACTQDFKIRVIDKELARRGVTKDSPANVGIGFSMDEIQRMSPDDPKFPRIHKVYPLIDLRLNRNDCLKIIQGAGLPVPPKSSCYFCPFHSVRAWIELRDKQPELYAKSVELEQFINTRRAKKQQNSIFSSDKLVPLDKMVELASQQTSLIEDTNDACGVWHCMT